MLKNLSHSRELTFQASKTVSRSRELTFHCQKRVSRLREAFNLLSKKSIRQSITGIDDRLDRPP